MLDFLTYDAKVAVLILAFYICYRLLLSKETFHRVNRLVLLGTAVLSFLLPLCVITMHETVVAPRPEVTFGELGLAAVEEQQPMWWHYLLPVLFVTGAAITLGHTLASLVSVLRLIRTSEQHPEDDGTVVCVTDQRVSPFSWMHYIVMNREDYEAHDAAILAHERGHIRLRHSWDLLLVDTLTALQWFNPAMWMLRQDLRAIHEYEADGAVLSQGFNARQYQYLLITKAASIGGYSIANGISHSTLKNRIHMMLHKETKRSHLVKLLALLPIVGTALALNAETVTDYQYDTPQKKQIIKEDKQNAQSKPFDVVEQMPQFPGGIKELMTFLSQNVRYPEAAHKAGQQGRVIANFVVEKDGSITEACVVKSVSPELDAEALRVISSMPNWIPGMQNGEAVRVKYTVPITFRLQSDNKPVAVQVQNN